MKGDTDMSAPKVAAGLACALIVGLFIGIWAGVHWSALRAVEEGAAEWKLKNGGPETEFVWRKPQ